MKELLKTDDNTEFGKNISWKCLPTLNAKPEIADYRVLKVHQKNTWTTFFGEDRDPFSCRNCFLAASGPFPSLRSISNTVSIPPATPCFHLYGRNPILCRWLIFFIGSPGLDDTERASRLNGIIFHHIPSFCINGFLMQNSAIDDAEPKAGCGYNETIAQTADLSGVPPWVQIAISDRPD